MHSGPAVCLGLPANFAWGEEDGRTLYKAAKAGIVRMGMGIGGRQR